THDTARRLMAVPGPARTSRRPSNTWSAEVRRHDPPDPSRLNTTPEEHHVRATVIYGPGDIRVEDRPEPSIVEPSDAVIRTVAACVCGSDLWRYRGIADVPTPTP